MSILCIYWPSVCLLWRKVCLGLLLIFWFGLFVFLIFGVNCSYILEVKPLVSPIICKYFPLFCGLSFRFVYGFFWLQLLLLSRFSRVWLCATPQTAAHQAPPRSHFIFAFISIALGDWPKKTLVWFTSENVLLMFFCRSFMMLCLLFKSLSHFIFVYGVRVCSKLVDVHVAVQLS